MELFGKIFCIPATGAVPGSTRTIRPTFATTRRRAAGRDVAEVQRWIHGVAGSGTDTSQSVTGVVDTGWVGVCAGRRRGGIRGRR